MESAFALWTPLHIHALSRKLAEVCSLTGDGFYGPPPASDEAYWTATTAVVRATSLVAQPRSPPRKMLPATLAELCRNELEVLTISEISKNRLFLCSAWCAQSPLARSILGIKGVIMVGDAASDRSCGTAAVHSIDISLPLSEQLVAAVRFLNRLSGPGLVCSSTVGGHGEIVCAAALATNDGLSAPVALAEVRKRCSSQAHIEHEDEAALGQFCDAFLRVEFQLLLGESSCGAPKATAMSPERCSPVDTPMLRGTKRPQSDALARSPLKRGKAVEPMASPMAATFPVAFSLQSKRTSANDGASAAAQVMRTARRDELDGTWHLDR